MGSQLILLFEFCTDQNIFYVFKNSETFRRPRGKNKWSDFASSPEKLYQIRHWCRRLTSRRRGLSVSGFAVLL
jgi:hypothetical protein